MWYQHGTLEFETLLRVQRTCDCVIHEWTLLPVQEIFRSHLKMPHPRVAWHVWWEAVYVVFPITPTHISHTFSPGHTLTDWPPVLLARLLAGQKAHMLFTHPGPDAKTSAAPCQWSKYFQQGARTATRQGRGPNSIGIVCGLSADKWASDGHPYGRPVSQPRRRLKGPQKIMWCLTAATHALI